MLAWDNFYYRSIIIVNLDRSVSWLDHYCKVKEKNIKHNVHCADIEIKVLTRNFYLKKLSRDRTVSGRCLMGLCEQNITEDV
jgi:hypothetical protein